MQTPLLEISGLSVRRDIPILSDIDWRIDPNEHWVILGANGSGKTTLLRTLLAYTAPTEGTISLFGESYGQTDWREIRKHVGVVSNHLGERVASRLTIRDIVESGRDAAFRPPQNTQKTDPARVTDILRQIQCEDLQNRSWMVLSQGERQRTLIGRALMADYRLLILDEPCVGLDPVARHLFLQFLDGLMKTPGSPAIILVTHHVEEILPGFTHVCLLKNGKMLTQGPKKSVLTNAWMSEAFDAEVAIHPKDHAYALTINLEKEIL